MTFAEAVIIAIVEGLTEFLPVSSTGHMMITTAILGITPTPFVKLFTVAIQLGAILSVVVLYFRRFLVGINLYVRLLIAFIPCAVAGLLFGDWIDRQLENVLGVAIALFVGGIVLLFIDKWIRSENNDGEINARRAFSIGLFQCLALFPGVSRSASTIIGGIVSGLSRRQAAEFSFLLAVPTMFAATAKKMLDFYKEGLSLTKDEISLLCVGNVVAFLVAMAAIRIFIRLLATTGFKWFGYYRIAVGGILIILFILGKQLTVL